MEKETKKDGRRNNGKGYRKPEKDDLGNLICRCTIPKVSGSWPDGKHYCTRCFGQWYR
jgi:hypothetical protein